MNFTEEDLKKAREFAKFLNDKAKFELSTQEAVQLVQYFNMYQTLLQKIQNNILELKRVIENEQNEEKQDK